MIVRAISGWQTATADLALILFLITAQAVRDEPEQATPELRQDGQVPIASSALAVHKPAPGEDVRGWLLATVTDERQVATVTVSYTPDHRDAALVEGSRLLGEAEKAGISARLVAIPDIRDDTVISVEYLRPSTHGTNLAD